jgi:hypothetical protein
VDAFATRPMMFLALFNRIPTFLAITIKPAIVIPEDGSHKLGSLGS